MRLEGLGQLNVALNITENIMHISGDFIYVVLHDEWDDCGSCNDNRNMMMMIMMMS
jgi:hypothetical protein